MSDAKKCDVCGVLYEPNFIKAICPKTGKTKYLDGAICVINQSNLGTDLYYDLCPDCFNKVIELLKIKICKADTTKKVEPKKIVETTKAMEMLYNGYSQHDAESHYLCPNCRNDYGSWYFVNKNLKHGEIFKCEHCDQNLIVPD